jgi:hypothetical protein
MKITPQQIAGYAAAAGFPPDQIQTATAVALAESGGETTATNRNSNGSTDYGLWQINTIHGQLLNQGDKFNPLDNAKMALTVYARAGNKWTPWTVYKTGAYQAQMNTARMAASQPTPPVQNSGAGAAITANVGDTAINASVGASPSGALGSIGSALEAFSKLTSGSLWLRIGAFVLGSCLIGFSLFRLSGADKLVGQAVGVAGKAAKTAVTKGAL